MTNPLERNGPVLKKLWPVRLIEMKIVHLVLLSCSSRVLSKTFLGSHISRSGGITSHTVAVRRRSTDNGVVPAIYSFFLPFSLLTMFLIERLL